MILLTRANLKRENLKKNKVEKGKLENETPDMIRKGIKYGKAHSEKGTILRKENPSQKHFRKGEV